MNRRIKSAAALLFAVGLPLYASSDDGMGRTGRA